MIYREIDVVVPPRTPHFVGDGFRVQNFIPSAYRLDMKAMDPFIFLDYNAPFYFEPTDTPRGVDVHPHRGFETVTVAFEGKVAHHDSAGNSGVVTPGGVQWMTAASGVLHKEYHEAQFAKEGGIFSMAQLWVNLPAKNKMDPPKYQGYNSLEIPVYKTPDGLGVVQVIAGSYQGVSGKASTHSPMHLLRIDVEKGADLSFSFPKHYNTGLLVATGSVLINGTTTVTLDHYLRFGHNEETFKIEALENSKLLLMSGEPLNEPIAAQGPFVMNTKEQLLQAMRDFYEGKFGELD